MYRNIIIWRVLTKRETAEPYQEMLQIFSSQVTLLSFYILDIHNTESKEIPTYSHKSTV